MDAGWEFIGFIVIVVAAVLALVDVAARCNAGLVSIINRSGRRTSRRPVRAHQRHRQRPRYGAGYYSRASNAR